MNLYLMQHGQALSEQEDPARPLSEEGRRSIRASASALRRMGLHFDVIIASAKVRSRETAERVADAVGYARENIRESDAVKPSAPPEEALAYLQEWRDSERLFIAGHMPSLAKLTALLLAGQAGSEMVAFQNGGLCTLRCDELEPGKAVLHSCLTPEQLAFIVE